MKTTIETIEFPCEIKKKLKMKVSMSNLEINYIDGHLIKFDKTNLSVQEPHKIIFSNKNLTLIALLYNGGLNQEQKQYIINKYIDEIEISSDSNHNVSILNVIFNRNEIENIGLMFRNDCFDMIVNVENRDIILSSVKNQEETKSYITTLRNFYNIKETTIQFDRNKFTVLQIEV